MKSNENGFEGRIYFRITRTSGADIGIKLDFTRKDNEILLFRPETKQIVHPFSDECKAEVKVYSLKEMVAEKIRSLFQRVRPRDLYDVWSLRDRVDYPGIVTEIREKCLFRNIVMDLDFLYGRRDDYRAAWNNSLRHQMNEVPDFEMVFEAAVEMVEEVIGRSEPVG